MRFAVLIALPLLVGLAAGYILGMTESPENAGLTPEREVANSFQDKAVDPETVSRELGQISSKLDRIIDLLKNGTLNVSSSNLDSLRQAIDRSTRALESLSTTSGTILSYADDVARRTSEMEENLKALAQQNPNDQKRFHLLWTPRQLISKYGPPDSISGRKSGGFIWGYKTPKGTLSLVIDAGVVMQITL